MAEDRPNGRLPIKRRRFLQGSAGARFTIANPGERSFEEHPWAIRFAIDLRRSGIDLIAFSSP